MNDTFFTYLFDQLKKQGFNVMILCGVIWWFNAKYDKLDERYDDLNKYVRTEFKTLVERDTEAFNKFVDRADRQNKD